MIASRAPDIDRAATAIGRDEFEAALTPLLDPEHFPGDSAPVSPRDLRPDTRSRAVADLGTVESAPAPRHLAVAVSGGADSMALVLLLQSWCGDRGVNLAAFTVDHRLRPEAAAEARQVGAWLAARGISHETLIWQDGAARASIDASAQADGRAARYRLLIEACRARGIGALALAHHADDQVETFLMRLTRGSGLEGLTAMAPATARDGIRLLRPLLTFPKARLEATCRAVGQRWISDPSNQDDTYGRVRFRKARAFLADEGLSDDRLLSTVGHLQRAQRAIDQMVADLACRAVTNDRFGLVTVMGDALRDAAEEIALRLLARVLTEAAGAAYGPRFEGLERLYDMLCGQTDLRVTLGGCIVEKSAGTIRIYREAAAIDRDVSIAPNQSVVWDGRFRLSMSADSPHGSCIVTRLHNEHWLALKSAGGGVALESLPRAVLHTLPVLLEDNRLVAVPHAGWSEKDVGGRNQIEVELVRRTTASG